MDSGYEIEAYNKGNHDVYQKEPVYNYEMHVSLFDKTIPGFLEYYSNLEHKYIWDDKENTYARHMDVNDAYVYIVAHAYKHYIFSGTGIRTLIDLYVYNEHCKDQLDRNYIHEQCTVLGIQEYEEKARTIAYKLFDQPVKDFSFLTQEESEYIEYYFSSGTYGTARQRIQNRIHKLELEGSRHAKSKYIFQRLFPSVSWFREHNKFLDAYPFLIPFYAIIRLVTKPFTSWSKWIREVKDVKESK